MDSINSVVTVLRSGDTVETGSSVPYFSKWTDVVEIEKYLVVTSDGIIHCTPFFDLNDQEKWAELATIMVYPDTLPVGDTDTS